VHEVVVGKVVGQGAGERPVVVVAPVLAQADLEDAHLEHVARLGALDRDRPGEDVRAERDAGLGRVHGEELGRHVEAGRRQHLRAAAHRVDGDAVAACHREHGRAAGIEIAPVAVFRRGGEVMVHWVRLGRGRM